MMMRLGYCSFEIAGGTRFRMQRGWAPNVFITNEKLEIASLETVTRPVRKNLSGIRIAVIVHTGSLVFSFRTFLYQSRMQD